MLSGKRKRLVIPINKNINNNNKGPRQKLLVLSISLFIKISIFYKDNLVYLFLINFNKICTRDVLYNNNLGFIRADYIKYKEIIAGERLIKDNNN